VAALVGRTAAHGGQPEVPGPGLQGRGTDPVVDQRDGDGGRRLGKRPRDAARPREGVSGQSTKIRVGGFLATNGQKPWPSAG
jgi:hypothetical protein